MERLTEAKKNEAAQRKLWTMNCILVGAEAFDLLIADEEDKEGKVKELLKNLTSEFEPNDISYLMYRLKQLNP